MCYLLWWWPWCQIQRWLQLRFLALPVTPTTVLTFCYYTDGHASLALSHWLVSLVVVCSLVCIFFFDASTCRYFSHVSSVKGFFKKILTGLCPLKHICLDTKYIQKDFWTAASNVRTRWNISCWKMQAARNFRIIQLSIWEWINRNPKWICSKFGHLIK